MRFGFKVDKCSFSGNEFDLQGLEFESEVSKEEMAQQGDNIVKFMTLMENFSRTLKTFTGDDSVN